MTGLPIHIRALQVVMLRLSIDPAWGTRLYAGQPSERVIDLSGGPYTLTDADLELIRAVDRRAWTTDRYRRARLVQSVVQEYSVTTAMMGVPVVDRFFGTAAFAHVLGHRGSMAEGFGDWVVTQASGGQRDIARLESTVCRARRGERPPGTGYVTRPGCEGVALPEGTLAAWQEGTATLGGNPVAAAAEGRRWTPPPLGKAIEHLLIERQASGGLGVHVLSAGVVGLLEFCRRPRSRSALNRQARRLRIGKKEVGKVLRRMLSEDMLIEQA